MKLPAGHAALVAALARLAAADWQYRSRPDLAPPRLNITIAPAAASDLAPGLLFLAPFAGVADTPTVQHGPRQPGAYLFTGDGAELVWSGYGFFSFWATNFQAGRVRGEDVLFSFEGDHNAQYGHGHGHITFLDGRYETVRELRAGNHKIVDKHEFHIVGEKTGLIEVYQPVPWNLSAWGGSEEQQWIVNAIIQEVDIETGKLLFEWSSLDHVSPDEAILPLNPGQAGSGYNSSDAWDYFHINSVDKDVHGHYLISARDACAIHKINGTSGEIIWRLGGTKSDFKLDKDARFCFQHHARWLEPSGYGSSDDGKHDGIEVISLYDNAAHGSEHNGGHEVHTAPTSSGKILRLDTRQWTAELVRAFYPPDGLRSKSQGSTQVLPGGHVLVGWGSEGAVTEFAADGTPLLHAYMDSGALGAGVQDYRAFKFGWTGTPAEDPAIVALAGGDGTTVYVSWNGDTETAAWRFYELASGAGARQTLGEVARTGFETAFFVPGKKLGAVSAEALDARAKVLRSTAQVWAEPEVLPARKAAEGSEVEKATDAKQKPVGDLRRL